MKLNFGLHIKYTIAVIIPLVLISGAVIAYLTLHNKQRALDDAQSLVNASTREYANRIKASLDYEIGLMQSISYDLSDFDTRPFSEIEDKLSYLLPEVLRKTDNFLATQVYFELKAINKNYKKDHGRVRFMYVNLDGEIINIRDSLDLDSEDKSGLYYKYKQAKETHLTNPYFDNYEEEENIQIASIGVPILDKEENWCGVVGVDIRMERFNLMVDEFKLYNGYAFLVSNDGTIISHPDRELIGKLLSETESIQNEKKIFTKLSASGKEFHFFSDIYPDKKQRFVSFAPIYFNGISKPWFLAIVTPVDEITMGAEKNFIISIGIGISGIIVIILLIWLLSGYITRPLRETTEALNKISSGHILGINPITPKSSDEIGQMSNALNKLTVSLKSITDFANNIGQGNLDTKYIPLGENDILGNALIKMQSDLRITNEQLANSIIKVEAATKSKSRFLANMSHEIRTPLNSIIGIVDILEGTNLSKDQSKYLKILSTSGESLLSIINDILDFSKIESEQLELERISFKIRDIISQVEDSFVYQADRKLITIGSRVDKNIPDIIIGDPVRVKQILTNLVGNAIKFTEKGGVSITATKVETTESIITIRFEVKDTGIGISESGKSRLFKDFSQTDVSTTREYGGTGLGLSISEKLVGLMNGSIDVVSEPGKGSTFVFDIQCGIYKKNSGERNLMQEKPLSTAPTKKFKILVAEDNPINIKVITLILQKRGHVLEIAENGKIAVEKFLSAKYDAILMDIQMPIMDGIEATQEIRKIETEQGSKSRIVIIAVTANAVIGDRDRFMAAGMDNYISKPFKPDKLELAIQEACLSNNR